MKNIFNVSKTTLILLTAILANILTGCQTPSPTADLSLQPKEIRKITPPKLDKLHLGERVLCHRPMRRGSPAMEIRNENGKIIADNYGHGGSGITLAPGAVKYVINLLEKESQLAKETPIAVVGAGVIGLFSALELVERGYKNVTVIAESFDNLTSHNAGGLIAPVSMDNDPAMQLIVDQIGVDAYNFYKEIALGNSKILEKGPIIVPTYWANREDSGLEPYVKSNVMRPAKDVIVDFQNGTIRELVVYDDGIFVDPAILMQSLRQALKGKVTFKKQRVRDFSHLPQKIIINCTGNGAKKLAKDDNMVSVQGHLIMLKDQNPADINHMILIYFDKGKTKSGFPIKRSFYMFPKKRLGTHSNDVGVIGGTFIEGADARTPNSEEFDIMIHGAKEFYGIKN
jgi:D-amino-acid oxidase